MAVSAHDDEIGPRIGRVGQDGAGHVGAARDDAPEVDLEPVPRQMLGHVGARQLVALRPLGRHHDDVDRLGAPQERHGVGDRARGVAACVPAHQDAIELEPPLLDVGHDQHGAAGLE